MSILIYTYTHTQIFYHHITCFENQSKLFKLFGRVMHDIGPVVLHLKFQKQEETMLLVVNQLNQHEVLV